ncbi:uncharacterized protein LOC100202039 [Hydra vulgaris]|uniref:Uncharacterized protein LOC100202039 n=1 Tax=Hydra vulgaris TaxID=6087 RepID=A0ABM4BXP6_HYDVU
MHSVFCLIFATICNICIGSHLNLEIQDGKHDCLYMDKFIGDRMNIVIQLLYGAPKVLFTLFSPHNEIILINEEMSSLILDENVHIPGAYALCFNNTYGYSRNAIVGINYDAHLDTSLEGQLQKRIMLEKRRLAESIMKQNRPSIMIIPRVVKREEQDSYIMNAPDINKLRSYEPVKDNSTETFLQEKAVLISINLDRMYDFINVHKYKTSLHLNLQEDNKSYVTNFSSFLCVSIVVSGYLQVVILKSFFYKRLTLKI